MSALLFALIFARFPKSDSLMLTCGALIPNSLGKKAKLSLFGKKLPNSDKNYNYSAHSVQILIVLGPRRTRKAVLEVKTINITLVFPNY